MDYDEFTEDLAALLSLARLLHRVYNGIGDDGEELAGAFGRVEDALETAALFVAEIGPDPFTAADAPGETIRGVARDWAAQRRELPVDEDEDEEDFADADLGPAIEVPADPYVAGPFASLAAPEAWTSDQRLRVFARLEAVPTEEGPRILQYRADEEGSDRFEYLLVGDCVSAPDGIPVATIADAVGCLASAVHGGKIRAEEIRAELRGAVGIAKTRIHEF